MKTPYQAAQNFIDAGYASIEITEADTEAIGVNFNQKTFRTLDVGKLIRIEGWERFCQYVYETVSHKPMPRCPLNGRGFRSQWYGKRVADAIRFRYADSTIDTAEMAVNRVRQALSTSNDESHTQLIIDALTANLEAIMAVSVLAEKGIVPNETDTRKLAESTRELVKALDFSLVETQP